MNSSTKNHASAAQLRSRYSDWLAGCAKTVQIGFWIVVTLVGCAALAMVGCSSGVDRKTAPAPANVNGLLNRLTLDDLSEPRVSDDPLAVSAAKNEWTSFQLHVGTLPATDSNDRLQIGDFQLVSADGMIAASNATAFQILAMPVDVNRAGYVRHTGLSTRNQFLPRALLPLPTHDGVIDLSALRDPTRSLDPQSRAIAAGQPADVWIDLHIPAEAKPGHYRARCDVLAGKGVQAVGTTFIELNVYDFVLPDERHLMMVGHLDWSDLTRLYPERFEAVTPHLLNRNEERYRAAIKTLDDLMLLAQENRTQLTVNRLAPIIKWPSGVPPQLAWDDYDRLVQPWLRGDMFSDKVGFGFWAVPSDDHLANYDPQSQHDYWSAVAAHFDQQDWIDKSAVIIDPARVGGRSDTLQSVKFSADAAAVLQANPRLRVVVPLEDDQVAFASQSSPGLIRPQDANRLITANPGVVFTSPLQSWPENVSRPARWLRTDLGGLLPYVGAGGDERDVRLWAWLAMIPLPPPSMGMQYGPVQLIRWPNALPQTSRPTEAADPTELVWFYPGSWFGVDQPVPTVQLKWLRHAQQDYEYLYLARQRGDSINSLLMARLMSKPVELSPNQLPDPSYGLMCGTADPNAWNRAIDLLAQRILMREPGQSVDTAAASNRQERETELNLQTLRWIQPQERPVIMARSTQWFYKQPANLSEAPAVDLRLGIDIYNASDRTPDENALQWTDGPAGWHWKPQPLAIPQLATYHVKQFNVPAHIDVGDVSNTEHKPQQVTFTDGYTHEPTTVQMVVPVAVSERREGKLVIDGNLDDWTSDDAIQDGPLIQMFNRPALQRQALQKAATSSSIYTGWADENFYLAFKVSGISTADVRTARNWVGYEFRRAWGDDLCQILIQPVYADGSTGPVINIAVKPNASCWVERKLNGALIADPFQPFESNVLYGSSIYGDEWRGELRIPWKAINDPSHGSVHGPSATELPVMLRFNFTQHKTATGESASWAGPVDFGRDDAFTGVLILREPNNPGMNNPSEGRVGSAR